MEFAHSNSEWELAQKTAEYFGCTYIARLSPHEQRSEFELGLTSQARLEHGGVKRKVARSATNCVSRSKLLILCSRFRYHFRVRETPCPSIRRLALPSRQPV